MTLTFADIEKIIAEIGPIPSPPKLRAHPDFVEYMQAKLPQADPGVMGHVEIKVVPDLPFRWEMRYDGKTTVEDHNGRMFTVTPPLLSWTLDSSSILDDMRWFREKILSDSSKMFEPTPGPIYMTRSEFDTFVASDYARGAFVPERRKRASKGWRRHVRRMKAADKREGL